MTPALPRSALTLWASALTVGSFVGYFTPPFELVRNYIESRNAKYLDSAAKTPFTPNGEPLSEFARKHPVFHQALHPSSSGLLEHELFALPIVKKLQEDPNNVLYRAWSGPHYQTSPDEKPWRKGQVFTANTLHQPGGIAAKPVVFANNTDKTITAIVHVGHRVTGFPSIVHGGVLATLLDETLGRTAFLSLPEQTGVTANLKLKYKNPTFAHQFIVIRTETEKVDGKKVKVKGRVETLNGKTLVEAEALFVVPKKIKLRKITS